METQTKDLKERFYATGKRKRAVARVYIYPQGKGQFHINSESLEAYFPRLTSQAIVQEPLRITKTEGQFDIYINVAGGGKAGQTEAVRHGISKALIQFNPQLRRVLKAEGLLTRDARKVERKKPGQSGARKRFQYSKR